MCRAHSPWRERAGVAKRGGCTLRGSARTSRSLGGGTAPESGSGYSSRTQRRYGACYLVGRGVRIRRAAKRGWERQRTDKDNVIVELVLRFRALTLAIHLGHLLKTVEYRGADTLVLPVDDRTDVRAPTAFELALDPRDVELHVGSPSQLGTYDTCGSECDSSPGRCGRRARRPCVSEASTWCARCCEFAPSAGARHKL